MAKPSNETATLREHNHTAIQLYSCIVPRMAKKKFEVPHPLPAPLVERIAERFRVLGEPMRIRLLETMLEGERSVTELQELTGASQQNVSQHLGVLLRA